MVNMVSKKLVVIKREQHSILTFYITILWYLMSYGGNNIFNIFTKPQSNKIIMTLQAFNQYTHYMEKMEVSYTQ